MASTNTSSPPPAATTKIATTKITSFFAATAVAKTITQQLNTVNNAEQQQQQQQQQEQQHFRLESCSPQDLVDALVAARGNDEASRILRDASTILAGSAVVASTTHVSSDANANGGDAIMVSPNEKRSLMSGGSAIDIDGGSNNNNDTQKLLGKALLSEPIETSFLSPRMGKFSLQLHEHGLVATKLNDPAVKFIVSKEKDNVDASSSSSSAVVSHLLLFPKPEDCKAIVYNRKLDEESKPKKVGGNLVVLRLESPVHLPKQKSPTQQLCFALPGDKKLGTPTGPSLTKEESESESSSSNSSDDATEAWGQVLHRALGGRLAQVLGRQGEGAIMGDNAKNKNNYLGFKSYQPPNTSTTTAGMPFVSCYLGVNDGVLYPLEEGLLFYKPPRFLPRSNLHSIACGRGGGGGGDSSRYVDMVVQCSNNNNNNDDEQMENIEFTNIQREENRVLNSYIHGVLVPAMTNDAKEDADGSDDDNDNDESDQVVVEAIAEESTDDDATEDEDDDQVEEVQAEDSDQSDSDEDFEESDAENRDGGSDGDDGSDSSDDDELDYGEDDEGIAVVRDDFAQELVNEKRKKREEESATESEDENSSSGGRRRISKRLRSTGA